LKPKKFIKKHKTEFFFIFEFLLITFSFFLATFIKRGNLALTKKYSILLLVFYALWFFSLLFGKPTRFRRPRTYKNGLREFARPYFYITFLFLFVHFIFQFFHYSRFIILATLIIYGFLEVAVYSFYYLVKWGPNISIQNNSEIESIDYMSIKPVSEERIVVNLDKTKVTEPLRTKIIEILSKDLKEAFSFIDSSIRLDYINASNSILLDTNSFQNILGILNERIEFIGNIQPVNNVRRINKFFIAINRKLIKGGYFFGQVETLDQRIKRKFLKLPSFLSKIIQLIDFIWTRIFPKLPMLQKIYFLFHRSKMRIVSESEILGRLIYCGFNIIKLKNINNKLHFIVQKAREPLEDKRPSYGPIFKQKRVGVGGKIIYTFKLRTMHPYSEYIHKYMYNKSRLANNGKIENDKRITSWGHLLRKYWIDEFPMWINYLRGDLKLVGLRPLSQSFFDIYPEDLKKERIKFKPGLIPSLYANKFESEEEIFEAEKEYIKKYQKHPMRTDFIYFVSVMKNIFFKGMRSG